MQNKHYTYFDIVGINFQFTLVQLRLFAKLTLTQFPCKCGYFLIYEDMKAPEFVPRLIHYINMKDYVEIYNQEFSFHLLLNANHNSTVGRYFCWLFEDPSILYMLCKCKHLEAGISQFKMPPAVFQQNITFFTTYIKHLYLLSNVLNVRKLWKIEFVFQCLGFEKF